MFSQDGSSNNLTQYRPPQGQQPPPGGVNLSQPPPVARQQTNPAANSTGTSSNMAGGIPQNRADDAGGMPASQMQLQTAQPQTTGPLANTSQYQQVARAYQQYLGRQPSYQEVMSQLGNGQAMGPQNVQWAINQIQNSPEAVQYAAAQNAPQGDPRPQPQNGGGGGGGGSVTYQPPSQYQTWLNQIIGRAVNSSTPAPNLGTPYTANALPNQPLPTYAPGQISQFQGPDQSQGNAQLQGLMSTILSNPNVMGPDTVAAMKEAQKESIANQQKMALQQATQSAAQRGTSFGGALGAQQANIVDQSRGQLAQSYRDIDTNAALQNFQSRLQAAGAGDTLLTSQLGRASQAYQNQLAGQQAQATQQYQGYQSQVDAQRYALESAIANEANRQAQGQQSIASAGLGLQNSQFNQNNQLAWGSLLSNLMLGIGNQGLSAAQLQMMNQQGGLGAAGF